MQCAQLGHVAVHGRGRPCSTVHMLKAIYPGASQVNYVCMYVGSPGRLLSLLTLQQQLEFPCKIFLAGTWLNKQASLANESIYLEHDWIIVRNC
jgi:hypothetical protein